MKPCIDLPFLSQRFPDHLDRFPARRPCRAFGGRALARLRPPRARHKQDDGQRQEEAEEGASRPDPEAPTCA
jgi:hypothetical protein